MFDRNRVRVRVRVRVWVWVRFGVRVLAAKDAHCTLPALSLILSSFLTLTLSMPVPLTS